MLSFRLRNIKTYDEGLNGVMAFTPNSRNFGHFSADG